MSMLQYNIILILCFVQSYIYMCLSMFTFQENGRYGDLFSAALRNFSILCIGLYRFRDTSPAAAAAPSAKRYVITNPPDDFPLHQTDKVGYHIVYMFFLLFITYFSFHFVLLNIYIFGLHLWEWVPLLMIVLVVSYGL